MYIYTYRQTDIYIYTFGGWDRELPSYRCISSLWPFYTFLDKSSLENYLIDKMLHKRGVTEGY